MPPRRYARSAAPRHHAHLSDAGIHRKGVRCGEVRLSIPPDPIIEATIPSSLDDTLASAGRHVMSMFTQYLPHRLAKDAGTLGGEQEAVRRAAASTS